jgi:hypothetical protein
MYKCEFGQVYGVGLLKSTHTKFMLPFLSIPTSFYKFGILNYFLLFKTNGKEF